MSRLYSYIALKLLGGILLSGLVLSGIAFISSFIRDIGNLPLLATLGRVMDRLPGAIYELLPLGCIIGTVIVLRSLTGSNELVIARCLGLSGWRLASLIAAPAFLLGLVAMIWSDYVVVPMQQTSRTEHHRVWIEDEEGLLYIGRLPASFQAQPGAENVVRFVFGRETEVARAAQLTCDGEVCHGIGKSYWGNPITIKTRADALANYGISPQARRLGSLWQQGSGKSDAEAWQLWQRITNPFFLVSLALLMGVFVLYSSPRASLAGPLIIAIGLGFLTDTLLRIVTFSAMLYQLPLWLGFLIPLGAIILTTSLMIARKT